MHRSHCPGLHHRPAYGHRSGPLLTALAAGVMLASCANPNNLVLTNLGNSKSETNPDSVRITTERLPNPPFLELGYVYAQGGSLEAAVRDAKIRSAKIGGTVIMDARAGVNITQIGTFLVIPVYDRSYSIRGIVAREKRSL